VSAAVIATGRLAEVHDAVFVVDRHFARTRQHIHADEQGRLVLQAPQIEDVEIADVRGHAVDDGLTQAQTRRPDTLGHHDGAPEREGVAVVILDRAGGDVAQCIAKALIGERDVGAGVDQHVDAHSHDRALDHQQRAEAHARGHAPPALRR